MIKTRALLALIPFSLLLPALPPVCAYPADEPPPQATAAHQAGVLATVNGEPIYFEDLERLLGEMHRGAEAGERRAPDLDRAMFRLVNDKLLAQEARSLGMDAEEPIPTRLAAKRESLAVARLEQEEIWARAEPSETEIEQAFAGEYRRITLRLITVYEREEAAALIAELSNGADFAELARARSVDQYAPRGGLVENLARIDLPRELADEAFAASPGELRGPFATRLGWSLLRVESFADADRGRFDELKPSLRALVRMRKAEELRAQLGARLREAHTVVVDEAALGAIGAERLPDGRLAPKLERADAVIARVGERAIRADALERALLARWRGVRNQEAALAARPLVLGRMIQEELMRAEALARGYGDTPEAKRALSAYETELLVPRYLQQVVSPGIEVSHEEMERYYEERKESLHKPPRLHLRQLTVASEAEAQRLAELLRQGTEFAWLARQHSTDALKESGGDKGWVVAGRTGELFKDALFESLPGDVLGPVEANGGWVVMQVDAREEQGLYAFQEVSGNVRRALREQKIEQALDSLIQTLRGRSQIAIDAEALARMRITGTPAAEPRPHPEAQP